MPTAPAIWCSGGARSTRMDETGEQVEPEERVLIENVEALELAYFGTTTRQQPPAWRQDWERQRSCPG